MRVFKSHQTIDIDPYILLAHIRVWISDSYDVLVEHYHWWFPKDPSPPSPLDLGVLVGPTGSVNLETTVPANDLVDLMGVDDNL